MMEGVAGASHLPILTGCLLFFVIPTMHAVIDRSALPPKAYASLPPTWPGCYQPASWQPPIRFTNARLFAPYLERRGRDLALRRLATHLATHEPFLPSTLVPLPRLSLPLHTPVYRCLVPLPSLHPFPARCAAPGSPPATPSLSYLPPSILTTLLISPTTRAPCPLGPAVYTKFRPTIIKCDIPRQHSFIQFNSSSFSYPPSFVLPRLGDLIFSNTSSTQVILASSNSTMYIQTHTNRVRRFR
jgi:hypothetical protein